MLLLILLLRYTMASIILLLLNLIPILQESKVSFEVEERAKEMKKLHEQLKA